MNAVYGWPRVGPEHKGIIARIHAHTAHIASAVVPGAYLVEIFPFMKHIPSWLARWKREGLDWHARETEMFQQLNRGVADKLVGHMAFECSPIGFSCQHRKKATNSRVLFNI
jgi:hypothetical protein